MYLPGGRPGGRVPLAEPDRAGGGRQGRREEGHPGRARPQHGGRQAPAEAAGGGQPQGALPLPPRSASSCSLVLISLCQHLFPPRNHGPRKSCDRLAFSLHCLLLQIINEIDLEESFPHGGINMTGLQLINHANETVRQFVHEWASRNKFTFTNNGKTMISVSPAPSCTHKFCNDA